MSYTLTVTVIRAVNLADTQTFGTQDPYVEVKVNKASFKTAVHEDGGTNGDFNETFHFNNLTQKDIEKYGLRFIVLNKNITDSTIIGGVRLPLMDFANGEEQELTSDIKKQGTFTTKVRGQVTARVCLNPALPGYGASVADAAAAAPSGGASVAAAAAGSSGGESKGEGGDDVYCALAASPSLAECTRLLTALLATLEDDSRRGAAAEAAGVTAAEGGALPPLLSVLTRFPTAAAAATLAMKAARLLLLASPVGLPPLAAPQVTAVATAAAAATAAATDGSGSGSGSGSGRFLAAAACALLGHATSTTATATAGGEGVARECGAIAAVCGASVAFWEHLIVREAAGDALIALATANPGNCSAIADTEGGVACVIATMERRLQDKAVQSAGCLLLSLAAQGVGCAALRSALRPSLVVGAMAAHSEDSVLQIQCSVVLRRLTSDDDDAAAAATACDAAVAAGAVAALLRAMAEHPQHAVVQLNALWALGNLAHSGASSKGAIRAAPGIVALTTLSLATHAQAEELQGRGLQLLADIALGGAADCWGSGDGDGDGDTDAATADASADAAADASFDDSNAMLRFVTAAVAAMIAFPGNPYIQQYGCAVLAQVVDADVKDGARECGAIAAAVAALQMAPADAHTAVLGAAATALGSLAKRNAANGAAIASADGLPALLAALSSLSADLEFTLSVARSIRNIAAVEGTGDAITDSGTLPALLTALSTHGPASAAAAEVIPDALCTVLLSNPDLTPAAIAADALPLLVAVMVTHAAAASVQKLCCKALTHVVTAESAAAAVAAGVLPAVVAAMTDHPPFIAAVAGCAVLATVAQQESLRDAVRDCGGITAIVEDMPATRRIPLMQAAACDALRAVATDNAENGRAIACAGGIPMILAAIGSHSGNAEVVAVASAALDAIIVDENDGAVADSGGIGHLMEALAGSPDNALVQARCVRMLAALADNAENKDRMRESGAIPLLIAAMTAHPQEAELAACGCQCLGNLADQNDTNDEAIASLDGVAVITSAMRAHPDSAAVQRQACFALGALATGEGEGGAARGNADSLRSQGSLDAIIDAMAAHSGSPEVQRQGFVGLAILVEHSESSRAVIAARGIPVVVAAMAAHSDSEPLQASAASILLSLANSDSLRAPIGASGAIPLLLAALSAFAAQSPALVATTALLLGRLASEEGNVEAFHAASGIPALLAALAATADGGDGGGDGDGSGDGGSAAAAATALANAIGASLTADTVGALAQPESLDVLLRVQSLAPQNAELAAAVLTLLATVAASSDEAALLFSPASQLALTALTTPPQGSAAAAASALSLLASIAAAAATAADDAALAALVAADAVAAVTGSMGGAQLTDTAVQSSGCAALCSLASSPPGVAAVLAQGAAAVAAAVAACASHPDALPLHASAVTLIAAASSEAVQDQFRELGVISSLVASLAAHGTASPALAATAAAAIATLVKGNQFNDAAAVACGGVAALVAAMCAHPQQQQVQRQGAVAIAAIAASAESHKHSVREQGGIPVLLSALRCFVAQPDMQITGWHALATLNDGCDENDHAVREANGHAQMAATMATHADNPQVLAQCCAAIAVSCQGVANQESIRSSGCLRALVEALGLHPDCAAVQQHGCHALFQLCNPANREAIRELNGVSVVLATMARPQYRAHAGIQTAALGVLKGLATGNDANDAAIVEGNGLSLIVAAMNNNPTAPQLQREACLAINSICGKDSARLLCRESGVVPPLVEVFANHGDREEVLRAACIAWANLGSVDANCGAMSRAHGIGAIVMALSNHAANAPLLTVGFWALRNTVDATDPDRPQRDMIRQVGGIDLLLAAVREHVDDASLQYRAHRLLLDLLHTNADNCELVLAAGGVAAVVAAMYAHPRDEQVQLYATWALNNMKTTPGFCAALVNCRGDIAVEAAMGAFPRNRKLTERGSYIMKQLTRAAGAGRLAGVAAGAVDAAIERASNFMGTDPRVLEASARAQQIGNLATDRGRELIEDGGQAFARGVTSLFGRFGK